MFVALIPAAGNSTRMGAGESKLLRRVAGRSVLLRTLDVFLSHKECEKAVLLASKDNLDAVASEVESLDSASRNKIEITLGGKTRQKSVYNGLCYLEKKYQDNIPKVCVHDAARCLLSKETLDRVLLEANKHQAATAAIAVNDTISNKKNGFYNTIEYSRNSLVAIQTPQVFDYELIRRAHESYNELEATKGEVLEATDDASLVQLICPVKIVEGEEENIKITRAIDLQIAEALLT